MHYSKANNKALCAVLAIALVACPFLATAARVTPDRTLLTTSGGYPECAGYIPVWKPCPTSSVTPSCAGKSCACGQLLGYIPIYKLLVSGVVTLRLGNLISVDAVIDGGVAVPAGNSVLPVELGVALSVDVDVVLGPLHPIFAEGHGAPATVVGGLGGLVAGLLGTVVALVDVVLGAVVTVVDGLLVTLLGGGVRICGILSLKASTGLIGSLLGGLLGGTTLPPCGIPFLTALPSTASPSELLHSPLALGDLFPYDGSYLAPTPQPFFPPGLSMGGVRGTHVVGMHPVYRCPAGIAVDVDVDLTVLGLLHVDVDVDVDLGGGVVVSSQKVDCSACEVIGYITCVGDRPLK